MAYHDRDRSRLMLALLVTAVAIPAIWWFSRTDDHARTDAVAADTAPADNVINPIEPIVTETATTRPGRPNLPPVEAPEGDPSFMDGPVNDKSDDVSNIAVPAQPEVPPVEAQATYRGTVPGVRSCIVKDFTSGITLTVVNLDNGRRTTCVSIIAPPTQDDDILLHTSNFELLADLTDAPIPVEIRP